MIIDIVLAIFNYSNVCHFINRNKDHSGVYHICRKIICNPWLILFFYGSDRILIGFLH